MRQEEKNEKAFNRLLLLTWIPLPLHPSRRACHYVSPWTGGKGRGDFIMKLETFADVLASIKKNPSREFHLLLGNGFSIAYDSSIFSYNALHDFIKNLSDKDISTILYISGMWRSRVSMTWRMTTSSRPDSFKRIRYFMAFFDPSEKSVGYRIFWNMGNRLFMNVPMVATPFYPSPQNPLSIFYG